MGKLCGLGRLEPSHKPPLSVVTRCRPFFNRQGFRRRMAPFRACAAAFGRQRRPAPYCPSLRPGSAYGRLPVLSVKRACVSNNGRGRPMEMSGPRCRPRKTHGHLWPRPVFNAAGCRNTFLNCYLIAFPRPKRHEICLLRTVACLQDLLCGRICVNNRDKSH